MKKIMMLTAGLILMATMATDAKPKKMSAKKASRISMGIVGGVGHSWVRSTPAEGAGNRDFKLSPALGVGIMYSHNEHWACGSQLLISHEGYKSDVRMSDGAYQKMTVNPVYLRMPMSITYFFGKYGDAVRPKIYAGPTLGLKLDEKSYYSNREPRAGEGTMNGSDQFRTFDVGINAGIGANIRVARKTWFNIDAGYYHGLLDAVQNDPAQDYNANRNLRLNLGVMWGL